jgi:hypothetical protein
MMTGPTTTGFSGSTGPSNHPGHADQKSHGRKGGLRSEAAIRDTYGFDDKKTGLTAAVDEDGIKRKRDGSIEVAVTIRNSTGQIVGGAKRTIRPAAEATVRHDELVLFSQARGQGFATRYNAQVEAEYRKTGVKRITLEANLDVGGYAWARSGYDFSSAGDRKKVAERAIADKPKWNKATQAEIDRVAKNPRSTPADFAMIGHGTPGQPAFWAGKQIMLGATWEGVKEL